MAILTEKALLYFKIYLLRDTANIQFLLYLLNTNLKQFNMEEIKVNCPKCGYPNSFYPPRTTELLDSKCINCDEPLRMVLYDLQLPKHSQSDTHTKDKTMFDLDIEEVE